MNTFSPLFFFLWCWGVFLCLLGGWFFVCFCFFALLVCLGVFCKLFNYPQNFSIQFVLRFFLIFLLNIFSFERETVDTIPSFSDYGEHQKGNWITRLIALQSEYFFQPLKSISLKNSGAFC